MNREHNDPGASIEAVEFVGPLSILAVAYPLLLLLHVR